MATEPDAPADTSMMRIVHQALRRDLDRARTALSSTPPPLPPQRTAIAGHVTWMMGFLHAHHESEDAGLYRVVRERRPEAAELLDAMHTDHEAIAVAMQHVDEAGAAYGHADENGERGRLFDAIEALQFVLLPHLEREESEAMPVVSATITNAEWQALEKEHNLDGKSLSQLGREGHWLIDDVSPQDRATVLGVVPAGPRFVLLHGFAGSYRRHKARCWQPRARGVQKRGHTDVVVDAPIDAVWRVARDVTRTGEWSHECVSTSWLGGATAPAPGARFRGRNRQGLMRWGRICEIVRAEPYEIVWRTVPTTLYPDSSEWAIRLSPTDDGTRIEQTFRVLKAPKVLEHVYAILVPAHRDRTAALTEDLQRLGALAREPKTGAGRSQPTAAVAASESAGRSTPRAARI
jgi:hypothetical protein